MRRTYRDSSPYQAFLPSFGKVATGFRWTAELDCESNPQTMDRDPQIVVLTTAFRRGDLDPAGDMFQEHAGRHLVAVLTTRAGASLPPGLTFLQQSLPRQQRGMAEGFLIRHPP